LAIAYIGYDKEKEYYFLQWYSFIKRELVFCTSKIEIITEQTSTYLKIKLFIDFQNKNLYKKRTYL
jgi:hypothetical protein